MIKRDSEFQWQGEVTRLFYLGKRSYSIHAIYVVYAVFPTGALMNHPSSWKKSGRFSADIKKVEKSKMRETLRSSFRASRSKQP